MKQQTVTFPQSQQDYINSLALFEGEAFAAILRRIVAEHQQAAKKAAQ